MNKDNIALVNDECLRDYLGVLQRWLPDGKQTGNEYVAKNPTRSDKKKGSFKINLRTGIWADFANSSDKGNNPVSLYMYINGIDDYFKAAEALAKDMGIDLQSESNNPAKKYDKKEPIQLKQIMPIPEDAGAPTPNHIDKGSPTKIWAYKDKEGKNLGYACRFDDEDGKYILPYAYFETVNTGKRQYRFKGFEEPRPLFNLHKLKPLPKKSILLVEGEKCAEVAQEYLKDDYVVMTWPMGTKSIMKVDFSPVMNRSIIIWPDNDTEGIEATNKICDLLIEKGMDHKKIKIIEPLKDSKKGWDIFDAIEDGMSYKKLKDFIKQNKKSVEFLKFTLIGRYKKAVKKFAKKQGAQAINYSEKPDTGAAADNPFLILGYYRSAYYYLPIKTNQIIEISAHNHNKSYLLQLAKLEYWDKKYQTDNKSIDWTNAANELIHKAQETGLFTFDRVRGRGAWFDEGRAIIHLGDRLLVDNKPTSITQIKSKYIYEGMPALSNISSDHPLAASESIRLLELCEKLTWKRPIDAKLLAGWCFISTICGALDWRPHIWLTGSKGTGKSWAIEHIIKPSAGDMALNVQSSTTEAGIRQTLKNDAFPVIFDEAEAEDRTAQMRIQSVLELARQASSDSDGRIIKGTISHNAQSFNIRSCFAFASISPYVNMSADQSRITILRLMNHPPDKDVKLLHKETNDFYNTHITKEFTAGLKARSISMIETIRKNALTFSDAISTFLNNRREGDQQGALLAGAWGLKYDGLITYDQASRWIEKQDWSEFETNEAQSDEIRCIQTIFANIKKVQTGSSLIEKSIAELIKIATGTPVDADKDVTKILARENLNRIGIRVKNDTSVVIANHHPELKRILRETPWANNWRLVLERVQDSEKAGVTAFAGGIKQRGVLINLPAILAPSNGSWSN